MKKKILLLALSLMLVLSGMVVNAADVNSSSNPAPIAITEDSVLLLEVGELDAIELTVPSSLGYQEIVFPYGTDLANLEFGFDLSRINFEMSEDVMEAHGIDPAWLTSEKGYYNNLRERAIYVSYSENEEEFEGLDPDESRLKDGASYTVSLDGVYPTIEKSVSDSTRWLNVTQSRKFAFKVRIAGPEIKEGSVHEIEEGTAKECVIKVDKDFSTFTGVKCNGQLLTADKDYSAKSGSTIVTLSADYVKNLKVGEYQVKVVFTDSESEPATIKVVPAKNQNHTGNNTTNSPKTGDYNLTFLWIALVACSVVVIVKFVKERRRYRETVS